MQLEDEFGDIISKAWSGLGLTLDQVSDKTEIDPERLSNFENYSKNPTEKEVNKLGTLLNLDIKSLLNISLNNYKPEKFDYTGTYNDLQIIPIEGSVGGYPVFSYLLVNNGDCIIIDTAGSPELIIDSINSNDLKPKLILLTHSHSDHIGGVKKIKNEFNIQGHIFKSKLFSSDNLTSFEDNQIIDFNKNKIQVIHTPGHTQDSVTFHIDNFLFVGDLIFAGSIGRPNWSYNQSLESTYKVTSLPEKSHIFPGHGPKSTIIEEKNNNPFITE
tara:strand:- start:149 stop:964 length:816 start_codon:yes stop_codon:yes gene_type:complete